MGCAAREPNHGALQPFQRAGGNADWAGDGRAGVRDELQAPGPVGGQLALLEALRGGREQAPPDVPHDNATLVASATRGASRRSTGWP